MSRVRAFLGQEDKVVDFIPYLSLKKTSDLSLPISGLGREKVIEDIDYYLRNAVNTNHPGFMNPLWGGFNAAAFAGEIIANITNTSMYTYELAPMATLIEQSLIKRMCEILGFSNGGGTLTTGGSNGNMIGMMCARHHVEPLGQRRGFSSQKLMCFVSDEAHYSVLMAANVLGIGYDNVIKVACDEHGVMRVDKLEEEIARSRNNGFIPFCVVATAGTTVRGSFDPIRKISRICGEENIWLHIDAAWGGTCMFSPKYRSLMDGGQLADSVCWDPHKMMGIPLICSAFLIKRPEVLRRISSHGDNAHYIFHEDNEDVDLGRTSLQCGRRNDALKLFLAWREVGDAGWSRLVDKYMKLAEYLEEIVNENSSLEMISSRQWTNVCFRYTADGIDHDQVNIELRERIMKNGNFMLSRSNIGDDVILRAVISNPGVSEESLRQLVDEIIMHGNDILRGIPF